MSSFLGAVIYHFLVSFGVVLGAACFAGIAAVINDQPPLKAMNDMASFVKVWAIAIALGGSFNSLKMFEKGLLQGEIRAMAREVIYIICAMAGANCGSYVFIFVPGFGDLLP